MLYKSRFIIDDSRNGILVIVDSVTGESVVMTDNMDCHGPITLKRVADAFYRLGELIASHDADLRA
jgi:hypothetical protein